MREGGKGRGEERRGEERRGEERRGEERRGEERRGEEGRKRERRGGKQRGGERREAEGRGAEGSRGEGRGGKQRGGRGGDGMYVRTYCKWFDLLCVLQRNILSHGVYVHMYVCVLQMLLTSLVSCHRSPQDTCSPNVLCFPPHPHTIASVACSLLKKPWTESGSTQQQKEAIGTMLKCVGVGAVGGGGGEGGGGKDVL